MKETQGKTRLDQRSVVKDGGGTVVDLQVSGLCNGLTVVLDPEVGDPEAEYLWRSR